MFAKITYKQNIGLNMWKTKFSVQNLKLLMGSLQNCFSDHKRFLQIMFQYIFSIILEFRNLKFPELENWELEVPWTWELENFGTWELV